MRKRGAFAWRFLVDALSGRLGAPMMVLGYVSFAGVLLVYVSAQVYTNSLMEDVARAKRRGAGLEERIGILAAQYATMTSKSRVSLHCERDLGLVEATEEDVVRVAVDDEKAAESSSTVPVRVEHAFGSDVGGLSKVIRR